MAGWRLGRGPAGRLSEDERLYLLNLLRRAESIPADERPAAKVDLALLRLKLKSPSLQDLVRELVGRHLDLPAWRIAEMAGCTREEVGRIVPRRKKKEDSNEQ